MKKYQRSLVWLRRDYRLIDNTALEQASMESEEVLVCFIYDTHILNKLDTNDQRISFIMQSIREVDTELGKKGSQLIVRYGTPENEIPSIIETNAINALYFNRDYEPYAHQRDAKIQLALTIPIHTCKDSVIFEKDEIKTKSNTHYTVFTPYKNQWLEKFNANSKPQEDITNVVYPNEESNIQSNRWYQLMGFEPVSPFLPGGRSNGLKQLDAFKANINDYDATRDYPHLNKTSWLSPYIRFGCISIREMVHLANSYKSAGAHIWLTELVWRDFYQMVAATHPNCDTTAIKPIYDTIEWEGKGEWLNAWKDGQTGFPIIDAAMRQLNQTGLMHNRCRMITASFLCKTLLIDWREGEAYFAKKLLDFDFASNNGGWQWSSSSGCDAQPYFRIFNPYSQSEKFDSNGDYIRQYCPELNQCNNKDIHNPALTNGYPKPIVDYKTMRAKALEMYSVVKNNS